jgi:hypothetical protein
VLDVTDLLRACIDALESDEDDPRVILGHDKGEGRFPFQGGERLCETQDGSLAYSVPVHLILDKCSRVLKAARVS